jgi:hypothetical protein
VSKFIKASLLWLVLACMTTITLSSAAPVLNRIVPSTAEPGDQLLVDGESFGSYVRPQIQVAPDQQSEGVSRVILVNIGAVGTRTLFNCTILNWEDTRITFTLPEDAVMIKLTDQNGFQVCDTLLFYTANDSSPLRFPYLLCESQSPDIENLQVINVTAYSATVNWRSSAGGQDSLVLGLGNYDTLDITSANFTGLRNYYPAFVIKSGQAGSHLSDVRVFHSDLSLGNGIRQVVLNNLYPNMLYSFFIGQPGGKFVADSTRLVGGPYSPVQIGRSADNHNALFNAFEFRTMSDISIGQTSCLFTGLVETSIFGGMVSIFLVSNTQPADTSTTVGASIPFGGRWIVNLGSLRLASEHSRYFFPQEGDNICVTIDAGDQGFTRFEAKFGSPDETVQDLGRQKLQPVVDFPELFFAGNNLVSVPVLHSGNQPLTAVYLLEQVASGNAGLSRYLSDLGVIQTCYRSGLPGDRYLGNNFLLQPGEAYILSSSCSSDIVWRGAMFGTDLSEIVFPGAGIFYFSRPLQPDSLTVNWDAFSFLESLPAAKEIFTWDNRYQRYQSAFKLPDGVILGQPFVLRPGGGYIAHTKETATWNAYLPTGALLAGLEKTEMPEAKTQECRVVKSARWHWNARLEKSFLSDLTANSFSMLTMKSGKTIGELRLPEGAKREVFYRSGYKLTVCSGLPPDFEFTPPGAVDKAKISLRKHDIARSPNRICYGSLRDGEGLPLADRPVWIGTDGNDPSKGNAVLAFSDNDGKWWVNLANLPRDLSEYIDDCDSLTLSLTTAVGNDLFLSEVHLKNVFPARLDLEINQSSQGLNDDRLQASVEIALPQAVSLKQNYPNPFNPQTSINFVIPDRQKRSIPVLLQVFNLRGRKVKTLIAKNLAAGNYNVCWDGRDELGHQLSSGVYFYRLSLPETSLIRKMVILK